jgi:hypothetical protein
VTSSLFGSSVSEQRQINLPDIKKQRVKVFVNNEHNTSNQKTTHVYFENLPIRTKTEHIHSNVEKEL